MNPSKKKVLIVAPFPPPYGGIARYVQDLWEAELLQDNFELMRIDTNRGEKFIRGEGRGENTWKRWRLFISPKNWVFLLYLTYNYLEYLFQIIIFRPDVVHVHTSSYFGFIRSGVFLFLARLIHTRRILHLHNAIDMFYSDHSEDRFWGRTIRWSLRQANELVVLSEALRVWVKENLNRESNVIWNACNTKKYRKHDRTKLEEHFPEISGQVVVLMLGGLHEYKGAFDFLEVISNMRSELRKNIFFLIPGRGDIARAKIFIKSNNLEGCVLLPGMVPEEVKDDSLRGADIFVLPSYSEGQPIAILEAMSASLPVISTKIGSIPEVVEEGKMGYLIEPGDQKALMERLLRLVNDQSLREKMGVAARERIEYRHDINRLIDATASLYKGYSN